MRTLSNTTNFALPGLRWLVLLGWGGSLAVVAAAQTQLVITQSADNRTEPARESCQGKPCERDARACIDVQSYDLDLDFSSNEDQWTGTVVVGLTTLHPGVHRLELDAGHNLQVTGCRLAVQGEAPQTVPFAVRDERLQVGVAQDLPEGENVRLTALFAGKLSETGRHAWSTERTAAGALRFDCALQYAGAHHLFPCKASFYHPEDTPQASHLRLRIPAGLRAIGPGSLRASERQRDGSTTFDFQLDHAVPTWALGFAFGPYQLKTQVWPAAGGPLTLEFYRLEEHREAFDRVMGELPAILTSLEATFGPYPFPNERLAVVETLSASSANATWTGLGSELFLEAEPARSSAQDETQTSSVTTRLGASRVLSHELSHAWWGIGLSVASWQDAWLHESFASYGELVYLGASQGAARQEEAFQTFASGISPKSRLQMCPLASRSAATASSPVLWFKGPWVLRAMRQEIGGEAPWSQALGTFQAEHRFQTVRTSDWMATLEAQTGHSWQRFFDEWFVGKGYPRVRGIARVVPGGIELRINNHQGEDRNFHVPIDLTWTEAGVAKRQRILLEPGMQVLQVKADKPQDVRVEGLDQILGLNFVRVLPDASPALIDED